MLAWPRLLAARSDLALPPWLNAPRFCGCCCGLCWGAGRAAAFSAGGSTVAIATIAATIHVRRHGGRLVHGTRVRRTIEIAGISGTGAGTSACARSCVIRTIERRVRIVGTIRAAEIIVRAVGCSGCVVRAIRNLRIYVRHGRAGLLIRRVGTCTLVGGLALPSRLTGTIVAAGQIVVGIISGTIIDV